MAVPKQYVLCWISLGVGDALFLVLGLTYGLGNVIWSRNLGSQEYGSKVETWVTFNEVRGHIHGCSSKCMHYVLSLGFGRPVPSHGV